MADMLCESEHCVLVAVEQDRRFRFITFCGDRHPDRWYLAATRKHTVGLLPGGPRMFGPELEGAPPQSPPKFAAWVLEIGSEADVEV